MANYDINDLKFAIERAIAASPRPDRRGDHRLYLTWQDEAAILGSDRLALGDELLSKVVDVGVRVGVPRIQGIPVVWGSADRTLRLGEVKLCAIEIC